VVHVKAPSSFSGVGRLLALASAVIGAIATAAGCASTLGVPRTGVPVASSTVEVLLRARSLELHLLRPVDPVNSAVLVLYASGDGGWYGAAIDMFETIGAYGYPVAGISSRALVSIDEGVRPLTIRQLAADYGLILTRARSALGLPASTPAVLTGWSRGAAFAVLVGGSRPAVTNIKGVVAIGLPATDALRITEENDEAPLPAPEPDSHGGRRTGSDTYTRIGRIAPRRCAVIQASGDQFLAAAAAKALFGEGSGYKRFFAVPAHNHRFSGGAEAFRASLADALAWVAGGANE
jgi:hypothetical protein